MNNIEKAIKKLRELQPIRPTTIIVCAGRRNGKELSYAIECGIKALEKQLPKKPYKPLTFGCVGTCPICSASQIVERNHCYNCGQSLDWSDNT